MTTTDLTGKGAITITVDLPTLLTAANVVSGYDDDDGDPVLANEFRDEIHEVIVNAVVGEFLRDRDVKALVAKAVSEQVAEVLAATLDHSFQPMTRWGEKDGSPITLREALVKDAADQVRSWIKKADGYRDSAYQDFLKRTVDAAVQADLNGELKAAREGIRERVKAFAAEKLTADVVR